MALERYVEGGGRDNLDFLSSPPLFSTDTLQSPACICRVE